MKKKTVAVPKEVPAIGDEVLLAQDLTLGHVSAIHSDGSVDIQTAGGVTLTSVPHLTKVQEPLKVLNTKGWLGYRKAA